MIQQKVVFPQMVNTTEAKPWRFMLFGGVGAGKTTLKKALEGKSPQLAAKTQMIDYSGWGIDTPGEFIEMGHYRRVLASTAFDAQLLIAVQDATRHDSIFQPNYFSIFSQPVIGVITKMDHKEANAALAKASLSDAGVKGKIFCVSALTGYGVSDLRDFLLTGKF
ncbi:MAG: ethanolamine utilization protein EutP [Chloroflexi bacterium]|nr:MAG: ethanolamine utilization protein EutP [Chloroflexota bacterium]PIE79863.1 MAG: ethanolamine utilization protein EutP [Chloroflexota bacterium]